MSTTPSMNTTVDEMSRKLACQRTHLRYDPDCTECKAKAVQFKLEQKQKEEAIKELANKPILPLCDKPFGRNFDTGELTLCPEVMKVFRRLMMQRGSQIPPSKPPMEELADALWRHQGLSFEQHT